MYLSTISWLDIQAGAPTAWLLCCPAAHQVSHLPSEMYQTKRACRQSVHFRFLFKFTLIWLKKRELQTGWPHCPSMTMGLHYTNQLSRMHSHSGTTGPSKTFHPPAVVVINTQLIMPYHVQWEVFQQFTTMRWETWLHLSSPKFVTMFL